MGKKFRELGGHLLVEQIYQGLVYKVEDFFGPLY